MSRRFLLPGIVKPPFRAELRRKALDYAVSIDDIECWLLDKKATTGEVPHRTTIHYYRLRERQAAAASLASANRPIAFDAPAPLELAALLAPVIASVFALVKGFKPAIAAEPPAPDVADDPPRKAK